jgi:putative FmdB family regulatory protein
MPLYGVKCNKCGKEDDIFRSISKYDDLPFCCGEKMERQLSAPMVIADIQPYISQKTGELIKSRSHHRDHLKSHGLVEVGNEKMGKKTSYLETKQQKQSLRSEIAARLDTIK